MQHATCNCTNSFLILECTGKQKLQVQGISNFRSYILLPNLSMAECIRLGIWNVLHVTLQQVRGKVNNGNIIRIRDSGGPSSPSSLALLPPPRYIIHNTSTYTNIGALDCIVDCGLWRGSWKLELPKISLLFSPFPLSSPPSSFLILMIWAKCGAPSLPFPTPLYYD
jgi:hypothetical protein